MLCFRAERQYCNVHKVCRSALWRSAAHHTLILWVCGLYLASDLLLHFELLFWLLAALHIMILWFCGSQSSLYSVLSFSMWICSQLSSQSPELLPLMAKLPRATFFTNINMQNLIEVCGAVPLTTAEIFAFCAHFAYSYRWNAKPEVFLQETSWGCFSETVI